jgi:hypothetical protein
MLVQLHFRTRAMVDTANLSLPLLMPFQGLKHITHNEALARLDAVVQLAVLDRDIATPPGSPAEGDRYLVAAGATGAWSGWEDSIAVYADGAWAELVPGAGWIVFVADENVLLVRGGAAWDEMLEPRRNHALNPHFDEWFMGTSFSFSAPTPPKAGWTAEGWVADADNNSGTLGVVAVTRETFAAGQTDVPGGPRHLLRFDQTTGAGNLPVLETRIGEVRELAGTTVCVSMWLRCATGTLTLEPRMQQVFGSGGSSRVDVVPNEPDWTITTSWARYFATFDLPSIAGKSFGTPATGSGPSLDLSVFGPGGTVFRYDVAQVKIEQGRFPTPVRREDGAAVRNRCLELHERITADGVAGMTFVDGHLISATSFRGTLRYRPKSEGYTPAITFSALSTWDLNSAAVTTSVPSALLASSALDRFARLSATVSGYTAGQGASLRSPPSGGPHSTWIDIDARY